MAAAAHAAATGVARLICASQLQRKLKRRRRQYVAAWRNDIAIKLNLAVRAASNQSDIS